MNVSIVVTTGYLMSDDSQKMALENERLKAFMRCLTGLSRLIFGEKDEVVCLEYGRESRLKKLVEKQLHGLPYQYHFVKGEGFNQSIAKNAGADIASGDIICFINSDVILTRNIFDVLRSRFQKNSRIFATAARHDVFFESEKGFSHFLAAIEDPASYVSYQTAIDDVGWHHALRTPKQQIPTAIKAFIPAHSPGDWRVVHDFQLGYINYGELMAVTKEVWKEHQFDPDITAIVDSFFRDVIFYHEKDFSLELIHDQAAVFHLSGSDWMGQTVQGSNKYDRLIKDMRTAAEKYPFLRDWLVFSYFPEFDDLIEKYKIPFKETFDYWRTAFAWKYYREKDRVMQKYGIKDEDT